MKKNTLFVLFMLLSFSLIVFSVNSLPNGFNNVIIWKNFIKFIDRVDFNSQNITKVNYICFLDNSCRNTWNNLGGESGITEETDPLWSSNYTLYNSSWSSTYNSTYDMYSYNQTAEAIDYCNNNFIQKSASFGGDVSGTYNNLLVRNTQGLSWNNLTSFNLNSNWQGKLGINNLTAGSEGQVLKTSGGKVVWGTDLTGNGGANVSSVTCPLNYFVSAINNNTGVVTCTQAPSGGSSNGISFFKYNYTDVTYSTSGTTYITMPKLNLYLSNTGVSIIECMLFASAAATTTGVQLQVNVTGSSSQRMIIEYYSSTTALAICQGTTASLQCNAASSSGTVVTPVRIYAYTVRGGYGQFTVDLRSEVSGSSVNIHNGSWCRAIEI
jgi:hypothetical protein